MEENCYFGYDSDDETFSDDKNGWYMEAERQYPSGYYHLVVKRLDLFAQLSEYVKQLEFKRELEIRKQARLEAAASINDECCICMEIKSTLNMHLHTEGQGSHLVCVTCYLSWTKISINCPLCRQVIRDIDRIGITDSDSDSDSDF